MEVETNPDPADVALLADRIAADTAAVTGHDDLAPLAVFERDGDGRIVAGVHGWTWGGCCEISDLWVDESCRGRSIATELLDTVEAEASRRGCRRVVLFADAANTGPDGGLWTRRGYQVVGRIDDYPVGDAALWFAKEL